MVTSLIDSKSMLQRKLCRPANSPALRGRLPHFGPMSRLPALDTKSPAYWPSVGVVVFRARGIVSRSLAGPAHFLLSPTGKEEEVGWPRETRHTRVTRTGLSFSCALGLRDDIRAKAKKATTQYNKHRKEPVDRCR